MQITAYVLKDLDGDIAAINKLLVEVLLIESPAAHIGPRTAKPAAERKIQLLRYTHRLVPIGIAPILLISGILPCSGATLTVGKPNTPCASPAYSNIADAVTAANNGDTIEVCPGLYPEQLVLTKPVTIRGVSQGGGGRVLIQPAHVVPDISLTYASVITVSGVQNVSLANLAVDASGNNISGCTTELSGIHFYDASGTVESVAISGVGLAQPTSCTVLFPGNGFGVQIDQDAGFKGSVNVEVRNSAITGFSRDGILAVGGAISVNIEGNRISGVGPSTGVNQFGIYVANGATGRIAANFITQGNCGAIDIPTCYTHRSEGVVLRASGDGVLIENNTIANVQAGIFVNGAAKAQVIGNSISNVDALDGIHIQASVNCSFENNQIFHVGPIAAITATDYAGCGLNDIGTSNGMNNRIHANTVNDAYCGVGYITSDQVDGNTFFNTLYNALNSDNYPVSFPPPTEPGQTVRNAGEPSRVLRPIE